MKIAEHALINGYVIYISKRKGKLNGSYLKYVQKKGICPYELTDEEMKPIENLKEIMNSLEKGSLLQISAEGCIIRSMIGNIKTEGPYCEKEFFEVIEETAKSNYYESLIDLNLKLAVNQNNLDKNKELKKLYKGVDRYE